MIPDSMTVLNDSTRPYAGHTGTGKLGAIRLGKTAIRVSKQSGLEFIENRKINPDLYH